MIQTPRSVEERVRTMMASKTPLQRLRMASNMFTTAQALVRAGMSESEKDFRVHLFSRLYARDFTVAERERIVAHLKKD